MEPEERLPTTPDAPDTALDAQDAPRSASFTDLLKRLKGAWRSLSVALGVGMLLGWLVLGWLLFPVKWTNTDPWDLRSEHQERYLSLVAEDYWRTLDIRSAMAALDGWDQGALAKRLASMETREQNPERRQHLAALGEALRLPQVGKPLLASLFGQKAVMVGVIFSALPMAMAVVIAFSSFAKRPATEEGGAPQKAEEGEELSEEEIQQIAVLTEAQAGGAQGEEKKPGEEKKAEQATSTEATEEQGEVTDLLTNLFDDDSEILERLQALSKGLEDVDVDSLLKQAREIAGQLFRVHALRSQAA